MPVHEYFMRIHSRYSTLRVAGYKVDKQEFDRSKGNYRTEDADAEQNLNKYRNHRWQAGIFY